MGFKVVIFESELDYNIKVPAGKPPLIEFVITFLLSFAYFKTNYFITSFQIDIS